MNGNAFHRHNKSKTQLILDTAFKRINALQEQGRYEEALNSCLQIARIHPKLAGPWIYAATNCSRLKRWQDTIRYGQIALACNQPEIIMYNAGLYDILAYAYGELGRWDEARGHGLRALNMRARQFNAEPVIPLPNPRLVPPLPSVQTRDRNVIAFSLFGGNPKYCETAILNVLEQPHVYPHWVCRFYVDGSVPSGVMDRLRKGGAQIVRVEGPVAQWPGEMWRFLTLDDPLVVRTLFRDADSVISLREAGAVEQWLASGKRFHIMRDNGSHTDLIQAGLWGVIGGSLPPLQQLMDRFLGDPLKSRHLADQSFLRQYVWPYARNSLMQHDSVFGFMGGYPFPDAERPAIKFNVGYSEGASLYTSKIAMPEGSEVIWAFCRVEKQDDGKTREEMVCSYPVTVKDSTIKVHLPTRYAYWVEQGTACIRLVKSNGAV